MPRRPAVHTQADIRRIFAEAKRAGGAVEFAPDGRIRIVFEPAPLQDRGSSLDRELEEFEASHGQG